MWEPLVKCLAQNNHSINDTLKIEFISRYPEAIFTKLVGYPTFPHQESLELSYYFEELCFPCVPTPSAIPKSIVSTTEMTFQVRFVN